MNFDTNFTETFSQESNKQLTSIGSGNDLAPNRRQTLVEPMMTQSTDDYIQQKGR